MNVFEHTSGRDTRYRITLVPKMHVIVERFDGGTDQGLVAASCEVSEITLRGLKNAVYIERGRNRDLDAVHPASRAARRSASQDRTSATSMTSPRDAASRPI